MFSRFLVVLGQVSTLFLMMAVGYVLGKRKKITAAGTGEMSSLLLYVVAPCIIIDSFQTAYDPPCCGRWRWGRWWSWCSSSSTP